MRLLGVEKVEQLGSKHVSHLISTCLSQVVGQTR